MVARRVARGLVVLSLAASAAAEERTALADTSDGRREAGNYEADFADGSEHYRAGRWAEALAAFERSQRGGRSPNAELMIARCLRELGRRVAAVETFGRAEAEANARAALGEERYGPTATAAASEGATLRAELALLRVRVDMTSATALSVGGETTPLPRSGEDVTILREPGPVTVALRDARGVEQRQSVTLTPGADVRMHFAANGGAAREGLPPQQSGPRWTAPAAWASGALTVVGLSVFATFGLRAGEMHDDLAARCGPASCGPTDRADADVGSRDQVIANVGAAVAMTAGVATIVFLVAHLSGASPTR